jgi:hypothetical protein
VTPLPPVYVDGDDEYQVDCVEDSCMYWYQLRCHDRWTDYREVTWEPVKDVDRLHPLDVFHSRYPERPALMEPVLGGP